MSDRSKPWRCFDCREYAVEPAVIDHFTKQASHGGIEYTVELSDFHVFRCTACGNKVIPNESSDRLFEGLRAAAGLLTTDEIRAGREALGLTLVQLAARLNVHEATARRWEAGYQIPRKHEDNAMRALFERGGEG